MKAAGDPKKALIKLALLAPGASNSPDMRADMNLAVPRSHLAGVRQGGVVKILLRAPVLLNPRLRRLFGKR